jgi:CheY-like chemotaxis protein/HPt (histidine-containing phosphotransfer) domain-containing protein
MGGTIGVESTPGRGSTFAFDVRLDPARGSVARPIDAPVDLRGRAVLIVDDNATNRRVLADTVRHWGAQPTCAASGPEGLDALRRAAAGGAPFALVLLDGMMPDMDGFAVAERIGADPALGAPAVLMLTSADRQGDAARCRALGAAAYLVKPVKAADLNRAIAAALGTPATPPVRPVPTPRRAPVPPTRPMRVLVAEDNSVNQRVIVRLLEKFGHSVAITGDGREALAALDREPFDAVLMDVQMPQMDGFEATRLIRANEAGTGRRIPVVAMTAHAMKGDRERCLAAGMDDYVSKPVQQSELLRVLDWASGVGPAVEAPGPVQTPPPAAPVLDRAAAVARLGGDEELFAEVATVFCGDAPKWLAEIRRALDADDAPTVRRAAHGLKGAAGYVGGTGATAAAAVLERLGERGNLTGAPPAFDALAHEIARLTAALAAESAPAR